MNFVGALKLDHDQLDVWLCSLSTVDMAARTECWALLNRLEHERYERFLDADARDQYLVGRALTRMALSRYAGVPESRWVFKASHFGRPSVSEPHIHRNIHFSLSHTSGFVVLAVSRLDEVGVDIEADEREVDIYSTARAAFSAIEAEAILRRDHASARKLFFELWTLKEAYVKARGVGFTIPLNSFWFIMQESLVKLHCTGECDARPERWQFHLSAPRAGYKMALAVGSPAKHRLRWLDCQSLAERRFSVKDAGSH